MFGYIVKTKEGLYSYYSYKGKIFKRSNDSIITVAEGARDNFTLSKDNIIIYQGQEGNISMALDGTGTRVLLENTSKPVPNILLNCIFENRSLKIIYNIVNDRYRNEIFTQYSNEDRQWSQPEKIDDFTPLREGYRLVELGEDKYLLIYGKNMPEYQFGYREVGRHSIGNFKLIYATGHNILDYSFVITKEALHFAFIQNTSFISRVVYIRRDNNGLSRPIILWEGINIKNCLIGIIKNKLYIWWLVGGRMYKKSSFDYGYSFNNVEVENIKNTEYINKVAFVDKTPINEDNYIFNEVYVFSNHPHKPLFIEEENENEKLKREVERLREIIKNNSK